MGSTVRLQQPTFTNLPVQSGSSLLCAAEDAVGLERRRMKARATWVSCSELPS